MMERFSEPNISSKNQVVTWNDEEQSGNSEDEMDDDKIQLKLSILCPLLQQTVIAEKVSFLSFAVRLSVK